MSSIHDPYGNAPKDPFKGYKIEPVQENKGPTDESDSSGYSPPPPRNRFQAVTAFVLFMLIYAYDHLTGKSKEGLSEEQNKLIERHLNEFKTLLEALQDSDLSQDTEFLHLLSTAWHKLLEDSLGFKRMTPFSIAFRTLIRVLNLYPEKAEFSFGYYLSEYAGEKWIPFPYMELVSKIHKDHCTTPADSALSRWILQIDRLLSTLKENAHR